MLETLQRHDLVRVEPDAWREMLCERTDLAHLPGIAEWARRNWPVIVRRRLAGDPPGAVPAALCLLSLQGKRRIRLQLPVEAICERVAPYTLRSAREVVPPSWQPAVDALLDLANQTGIEPCLFGSMLWQRLTGLPYLSTTSDLDLLWRIPFPAARAAVPLARRLAAVQARSPVRLDGEIILPDGAAANWRELELHGGVAEVLVKTRLGVELRSAAALQ